ncbi:MAG: hypothetical protein RTU92_00400, partial [Candidatus Thorarchaeota archaeon]
RCATCIVILMRFSEEHAGLGSLRELGVSETFVDFLESTVSKTADYKSDKLMMFQAKSIAKDLPFVINSPTWTPTNIVEALRSTSDFLSLLELISNNSDICESTEVFQSIKANLNILTERIRKDGLSYQILVFFERLEWLLEESIILETIETLITSSRFTLQHLLGSLSKLSGIFRKENIQKAIAKKVKASANLTPILSKITGIPELIQERTIQEGIAHWIINSVDNRKSIEMLLEQQPLIDLPIITTALVRVVKELPISTTNEHIMFLLRIRDQIPDAVKDEYLKNLALEMMDSGEDLNLILQIRDKIPNVVDDRDLKIKIVKMIESSEDPIPIISAIHMYDDFISDISIKDAITSRMPRISRLMADNPTPMELIQLAIKVDRLRSHPQTHSAIGVQIRDSRFKAQIIEAILSTEEIVCSHQVKGAISAVIVNQNQMMKLHLLVLKISCLMKDSRVQKSILQYLRSIIDNASYQRNSNVIESIKTNPILTSITEIVTLLNQIDDLRGENSTS